MSGPMHGGPGGRQPKSFDRPKNTKATLRRLLAFMKPYHLGLSLVVVFAILSTVFNSMGPMVLGFATNEIQRGFDRMSQGSGGIDFAAVLRILALMAALYVVSALFSYLQNFLVSGVAQKTIYSLRKTVDQKLRHLPLGYFDRGSIGDVLSRVTNDVDTVATTLQQGINQVVNSVFTLVTILVMMMVISPVLTGVALLTLPLSLLASMNVVRLSQKLFKGQADTLGTLNGYVEEMYTGHNVVKVFSQEGNTVEAFDRLNGELYRYSWKANFISGIIMPVSGFIGNLGYIIVTVLGAVWVIQGRFLVGSIQSFIQYIRHFNNPIVQLANLANMLQSTIAAAERVFELLDEAEETPDPLPRGEIPQAARRGSGSVEFQNVSFGYTPDRTLINNLSLSIRPGETVAIVGPTGAGKTTLVNLILRFYEVSGGRILLDGEDIAQMPRAALRSRIGMVLQDTWLFSGTIRENIRYGRLDATDAEVEEAARSARADKFIRALPQGYDTQLGEDAANISQGQRQLLTIARAILSDPDILILDEATSSVDTRTEVLIQKAMNALMKGRTSFVIAHRLSTIRDAGKILVMRDGDIIEAGNHQELMAKGGFYAQLYQSQFRGEAEEAS
ncbi:MAG: ABC transporter ATP-binding protein [Angelakisella sp.]|jgi:ATP-binding cassette subfamily B multidrug efflux pump|nr:ABC transporter ATP-binding protein [Angelakisella sp.]